MLHRIYKLLSRAYSPITHKSVTARMSVYGTEERIRPP